MRVLILEDNRDRRVAMMGRLADRFPFLQVVFFDVSAGMIEFMEAETLDDVALISLDHDLELIAGSRGEWIDPGTGLDIARWLSRQAQPICAVVVHTTNSPAGDRMMRVLEEARWSPLRVVPHDDLSWIDGDWFKVVRNAIVDSAPRPLLSPVSPAKSKIGLIRSLIDGEFESGRSFCRTAVAKIAEAYECDLRRLLGEASVEVASFWSKDTLLSALEIEGPVVRWIRQAGILPGTISEWAVQGPLARDQLTVGADALERLAEFGVEHVQFAVIEIAGVQALLVVSAARTLDTEAVQALITELKQAIEIVVLVGRWWRPSPGQSELTRSLPKK
jgi:hypothetical protein